MCRLAAYLGAEIPLENIIARPRHSLLVQSQDAQEAKLRVNGDGFGIAWYGHLPEPGLFKDVLPAWADTNLPSVCRLVRSRLFLAHVRAATTGAASRDNCHPFAHGRWAFMHNGCIGNFAGLRRDMEACISDEFYATRRGTTDSELFFLLLLSNGLDTDPKAALDATLARLLEIAERRGTRGEPIRLTCAFSDGERIFAFRFADDGRAPSLYLSDCLDHGGRAFASEPLEGPCARWRVVEPDTLYELGGDGVAVHAIGPVHGAGPVERPIRSISS
ncbi:class II glutamine amidotransferase [Stappia sp.]|uniref:class II glutamine amidotransferase n=1 Tax=Stappia sp. TaxID=1870903 RepID=UPI003A9A06B5